MSKKNLKSDPIKYLQLADPILAAVIEKYALKEDRKKSANHFRTLVESIVSQQLSVKASDTIFKRFLELFAKQSGIKSFPKPESVLKMSDIKLRKVGLSAQKIKYIKNLSEKISKKDVQLNRLRKMSDEEVIEHLVQVKGIGRWTAEMFLMFSLQRPDVFSHGDLGLRNAIIKLYGFKNPPTFEQIEEIVSVWSPYRTVASRYLWKSLENSPKNP